MTYVFFLFQIDNKVIHKDVTKLYKKWMWQISYHSSHILYNGITKHHNNNFDQEIQ